MSNSFFSVNFYTFYILKCNYLEFENTLKRCLEATSGDEFLFSAEKQIELHINAGREIGRRIHNYAAAFLSVVDHSRGIYKHLLESESKHFQDFAEEYDAKRKEHFNDSFENVFIGDLRRYLQHKKVSAPVLLTKMERTEELSSESSSNLFNISYSFEFNSKEIKDFKWSSKSKEYINRNRTIPIADIITRHFSTMKSFYQWVEFRDYQVRPVVADEIERATFEDWQSMNLSKLI
jgi:hypothetical protein